LGKTQTQTRTQTQSTRIFSVKAGMIWAVLPGMSFIAIPSGDFVIYVTICDHIDFVIGC
jgi:hypothetical protein